MKKPSRITINPREPMTKKAREAIYKYAYIEGERLGRFQFVMIDVVLKAERMRREQLYAWLETKGYVWSSRYRSWLKKA